jgi:hypothetical protein
VLTGRLVKYNAQSRLWVLLASGLGLAYMPNQLGASMKHNLAIDLYVLRQLGFNWITRLGLFGVKIMGKFYL